MYNALTGLRSVFRSISSTDLLRQFFKRFAPGTDINWAVDSKALPDALCKACEELQHKDKARYTDLICTLQDLCDVCNDGKSPDQLACELKASDAFSTYTNSIPPSERTLQNYALWILMNDRETWAHLTSAAKAKIVQSKPVEEYVTTAELIPDVSKEKELIKKVSACLTHLTLHGEHVHVEFDGEWDSFRCFVSINKFPVNIPQFDLEGQYSVSRDATAGNFLIEYLPWTGTIRIKCPFSITVRRELVRIYAETILKAKARPRPKGQLNLNGFLHAYNLPIITPEEGAILSIRSSRVSLSYCGTSGKKITLSIATEGDEHPSSLALKALSTLCVPESKVSVESIDFEFLFDLDGKVMKPVTATLRTDGVHLACRDIRKREAIQHYLGRIIP